MRCLTENETGVEAGVRHALGRPTVLLPPAERSGRNRPPLPLVTGAAGPTTAAREYRGHTEGTSRTGSDTRAVLGDRRRRAGPTKAQAGLAP
ncbi:hypothetical protein [Streptomyces aureocirculatus]|uniref:hypothetical protein n=1 Tax=Streptomyces aureocirculatus TaxID=67275 RepID=UPI0004C8A763|nr:hypothetical protein [Streptomyces aureocirculatus]